MRYFSFIILFSLPCLVCAQDPLLKPGFDAAEYRDLIDLNAQFIDSTVMDGKPQIPGGYIPVYRSPEMGLKNRWDLWLREDKVAVISIRGTIQHAASWMENFYAAAIPATGDLQINDSTTFKYRLARDPKAAVHAGWVLGLAFLGPDVVQKIRQLYEREKVRSYIIVGHSQGGALSFLLRSYLFYLSEAGNLPGDISFKTYCSAAPKPGNQFYAYDFDFITRGGWGFNVINAADWVPETPLSIQTLDAFNDVNPFPGFKASIKKQKLLVRWYLNGAYGKMDKSTRKAKLKIEKYLGHAVYKQVSKTLPGFKEPAYHKNANYTQAGIAVVLPPDEDYFIRFPQDPKKIFINHSFRAYKFLLSKYY